MKKIIKAIIYIWLLLIFILIMFKAINSCIYKNYYPLKYEISYIMSGSMVPFFYVDDVIISKKINYSDVNVGDVVVYIDNSGNKIIHRVIEIDGENVLTKGDANNTSDKPININQIKGIYVCTIPFVGSLVAFIKRSFIILISTALIILMIIYIRKTIKKCNKEGYNESKTYKNNRL